MAESEKHLQAFEIETQSWKILNKILKYFSHTWAKIIDIYVHAKIYPANSLPPPPSKDDTKDIQWCQ